MMNIGLDCPSPPADNKWQRWLAAATMTTTVYVSETSESSDVVEGGGSESGNSLVEVDE